LQWSANPWCALWLPKQKKGWELWNETKKNPTKVNSRWSQLAKKEEETIYVGGSQNGAWMNHMEQISQ